MKLVIISQEKDGQHNIITETHIGTDETADQLARALAELKIMEIALLQQFEIVAEREADIILLPKDNHKTQPL